MTGTAIKDTNTKTKENDINISYYQIFRYATCLEKAATIIGVLLGFISGGGMTYNLIQIGELSTSFQERNYPPIDRYSTHLPLLSVFGGGERLYNATHEQNMAALVKDAIALTIGTFVSVGICLVLTTVAVWLINWSALRQITTIQMRFLKAVLRQDMYWYDTDNQFNLASMMAENLTKLKTGMSEKLAVVSNLLGTGVISFIMAIPIGWQLALACATMTPLSIATAYWLTNYQTKSSVRELESYAQAGKHAEEIMKSVKTVVAFGGESKEVDRYNTLLLPAEQYGCRRGWFNGLGNGFNWIITYCLNAIGLTYGVRLVIQDLGKSSDEVTYVVGTVFSVIFNIFMATQSITMSVPHFEDFSSACGAAASIFHIIERKPKIDSFDKKGAYIRRVLGGISLKNVSFCYPSRPDIKVLNNFSIHIKPGEFVALVGSSGCGKSTIIQLLQRLYDPLSGTVMLDGKDLKNLNINSLRSSLGVVGQEPVLFRGTVFENIAISCPEATREEVQRVAAMAYAHDFINKLPNGYDTVIGERGASLSGGQKQRIAIARSLLREPAVLLLDEATSALDPHSERQVQAALDRASVGRTTIMVSHRLATIANAQRIICMDKGAIVEQGTHDELMKIKGVYYKLVTTDTQQKPKIPVDTIKPLQPVKEEQIEANVICHDTQQTSENDKKSKNDILKKDQRVKPKHNSLKETQEWMTPRSSISSVVSVGYQSFIMNADNNNETSEDIDLDNITGWQILKMNAPEWLYIIIGSIAAFAQGACLPAFAVLFGFTSAVFRLEDHDELKYYADIYAGLFVVVASVAGICMCLQNIMFTTAGMKMTMRLRIQYFTALLRQEIGYYDNQANTVGAICARLSGDTAVVQGATGIRIGIIMQGISSILIGVLMGFAYNWKLTLVSSAFLPLMVGSLWFEGRMSQKSQTDETKAMEEATSLATEAVVSIKTVQSLGIETTFLEKFRGKLATGCAAVASKTRWRGLVLGMGIYVPFIAFCSAIVYGAILVAEGTLDYKAVFLVTEAVLFGAYMLGQTLVYATSVNNAKGSASKILSLVKRQPEVKTEDSAQDKKDWSASGNFSIKNVEFSYPTRKTQKVLKGINLSVNAGKTVALVGASGCGKSTVIQLMQRFYDPDSGTIELDGINTRQALTLPRLRQQIGVVQQEPVLFDRTIAENIAYGDNNRKVDMHEIIAVAKAANIHSFISSLPKGYETSLGSGGAQLSGGQKQRICIARALIRAPRLLLLDEATSALDANSEKVVAEALDKAAKGRTCITIAHRLSTIQNSDLICVLDKGKIIERGNHEELIKTRGVYYKMCKGQNVA